MNGEAKAEEERETRVSDCRMAESSIKRFSAKI
jgi:hypothetical protein